MNALLCTYCGRLGHIVTQCPLLTGAGINHELTLQAYRPCMERLMLGIAKYVSDEPAWWIINIPISGRTTLADFGLAENHKAELAAELQLSLEATTNLFELAEQMVARGDAN